MYLSSGVTSYAIMEKEMFYQNMIGVGEENKERNLAV